MSPLSREYIAALQMEKSFSVYEAAMLWIGEVPKDRGDFPGVISSPKPNPYYNVARKLMRAIITSEIPLNGVRLIKYVRSGDRYIVLEGASKTTIKVENADYSKHRPTIEGAVRLNEDIRDIIQQGGIEPYRTTLQRKALAQWAFENGQKPDFLAQDIHRLKQPQEAQKKKRINTVHKEKCREIAKKFWEQNPSMTIEDMISKDELNNVFQDRKRPYVASTLRDWIKDLCPDRSPGRRPKKS